MIAMLSDLTFNGCDDLVCYLPDTKALHICRWFFFFSVREDPANAVVPRKIGIRFIQLRINVRPPSLFANAKTSSRLLNLFLFESTITVLFHHSGKNTYWLGLLGNP